MATVLDAFALVALALDEPAADEVETIVRRGGARVAAVNLAEALDQLGRARGRNGEALRAAFGPVLGESVAVHELGEADAWRAVELRRGHYRRRTSELSLADCFALAIVEPEDVFVTADPPLIRAARAEGREVVALSDSRGRRP